MRLVISEGGGQSFDITCEKQGCGCTRTRVGHTGAVHVDSVKSTPRSVLFTISSPLTLILLNMTSVLRDKVNQVRELPDHDPSSSTELITVFFEMEYVQ